MKIEKREMMEIKCNCGKLPLYISFFPRQYLCSECKDKIDVCILKCSVCGIVGEKLYLDNGFIVCVDCIGNEYKPYHYK